MPLYIGDYHRDTMHLRTIEHGAYLLLIMHYWAHGCLPDDDRCLSKIAGVDPRTWASIRSTLAALFHDGWKHKRIDQEIERCEVISAKRSMAAIKRGDINAARLRANAQQLLSKSIHNHNSKIVSSYEDASKENSRKEGSLEHVMRRKGWVS